MLRFITKFVQSCDGYVILQLFSVKINKNCSQIICIHMCVGVCFCISELIFL